MWAAKSAAAVAIAAATFTPKTTTVKDATGDVAKNPMDLVRVSLGRASNGELRGSLTAAAAVSAKAPGAKAGTPGTVCLRLWTKTKAGGTPPDYLVCATADKTGKHLEGSVLQERAGTTPIRVGPAHVSRSTSHNVTLRFGQSLVGRPATIDFAAETIPGGCDRISCTDTAPEDGKVARFRLRRG